MTPFLRSACGKAFVGVVQIIFYLIVPGSFAATPASRDGAALVKAAIARRFCYFVFWERENRPGKNLALEIRLDGKKFSAWIDGLKRHPKHPESLLITGTLQNSEAFIDGVSHFVTGPNAAAGSVSARDDALRRFRTGTVSKDNLAIPTNCASLVDTPPPGSKFLWTESELAALYERIENADLETMREIWKTLGMWSELFQPKDRFNARRQELSPEGSAKLLIISIVDHWERQWQYLIFRREKSLWRFLGNIDLSSQRYDPPQLRTERAGSKGVWLVLRSMLGGGTGVADYSETWFDLSGNRRQQAVEYPYQGHFSGWGSPYGYSYQSAPRLRVKSNRYFLDVFVNVSYFSLDNEPVGFDKTFEAHFVQDPSSKRFILDRSASKLPGGAFQRGFAFAYHESEFVKYFYDELSAMARTANEDERKWLQLIVTRSEDTPQKRALQDILSTLTPAEPEEKH